MGRNGNGNGAPHARLPEVRTDESIQSEIDNRILIHDIKNVLGIITLNLRKVQDANNLTKDSIEVLADTSTRVQVIATLLDGLRYRR